MALNEISKDVLKAFKYVDEDNSLDELHVFSQANDLFYKKWMHVTNLNDIKLTNDFISHACKIVEQLYDSDTYKTDKKVLAINMLNHCLEKKGLAKYTDQELKTVASNIESLHTMNQFVKTTKRQRKIRKISKFFLPFLNPKQ